MEKLQHLLGCTRISFEAAKEIALRCDEVQGTYAEANFRHDQDKLLLAKLAS